MSYSSAASHAPNSSNYGSGFQSTGGFNENNSISKLDPELQEHVYGAELQKLLEHVTVLSPHDLLTVTFPDKKWDQKAPKSIKLAFKKKLGHRNLQFSEKDATLYKELTAAFNICCANVTPTTSAAGYTPSKKLCCIDIHAKRPETEDLSGDPTSRAPDLCLSFDTINDYSRETFFSRAIVAIEIKSNANADPRFTARPTLGSLITQSRPLQPPILPKPTKAAAELLLQGFGYVSSQWSELPYKFVWSITIAREILRIWRWSASGVLVTEAIDYINDATPVYHFLQAIGKGPYSSLGLDIGRGMTLCGVKRTTRVQVAKVVDCYLKATAQTEMQVKWSKKALQGDVWRFEQTSSVPGFPKVTEGSTSTEENHSFEIKDSAIDLSRLYVLSHPIWRGKGVYSRGTRCYLAISQSTFENQETITVEDLRMLKTSWQTASGLRESDFFERVQTIHNECVPHLATMLAAGSLESTLQNGGRALSFRYRDESEESEAPKRDTISTKSQDSALLEEVDDPLPEVNTKIVGPALVVDPAGRQLQWIVFKQVGERISGFRSEKELLQVILDAIKAHEHLYNAGILHGDVSENNVLIELGTDKEPGSTRGGLLIDLDMARLVPKDESSLEGSYREGSQYARRPEVTGTLLFMSAAMSAVPSHHCWHDLESFYWLLLFITLRHVQGLKLSIPDPEDPGDWAPLDLDRSENRTTILSRIFPVASQGKNILATFCKAKQAFITEKYAFKAPTNKAFATVMNTLYRKLNFQYKLMRKMQDSVKFLEEYAMALKLPVMSLPFRVVFKAHTVQDLMAQIAPMKQARDDIKTAFENLERSKQILVEYTSPSSQEMTQDFEEARKFIKGRDLDDDQCSILSTTLPQMRREILTLEEELQELNGFPDHLYFVQALKATIKAQYGIAQRPAAPYQSKKRELAPDILRAKLALSGSGHVSYTMGSRGANSLISGEASSDRAKRKRSPDQGGSDKRQKKTHPEAGSSQATRLHN